MFLSVHEYLKHIIDETKYVMGHTEQLSREDFLRDETLKRSFVRSIEIIGEVAKKVPDDFRLQYPDINWRAMAGMRDKLIHDYFGIDYEIVWDVVINNIPELHQKISQLLLSHN
jgi:uncharacterized protein with HEPN domain